jgi:hypothetical protein
MNRQITGKELILSALIGCWLYGKGTPPPPALARR